MASVNDKIVDDLLRHIHFVRNYENDVLRRVLVPALTTAKSETLKILRRADRVFRGKALDKLTRADREVLKARVRDLNLILSKATRKMEGGLDKDLATFARGEEPIYRSIVDDNMPVAITMNRVPLEAVDAVVKGPIGGATYSERLKKIYGVGVNIIQVELAAAIAGGLDMTQLTNRLIGAGTALGGKLGQLLSRRAEMIARSEVMRVSNAVNDKVFRLNDDIIKGVTWVATLDGRTCQVCSGLDGTFYDYRKGEVPPERPHHVFCRCVVTPVTMSWKELGLKGPDLPPGFRSSMNGYVPSRVKYPEWFDRQSDVFKHHVLGKTRYGIYKRGGLKYDQMVKSGRWITVKNLAKMVDMK